MRGLPPISAHEKREKVPLWNPSKSTFRASPAPRGHRPPSGGKFELLQPRARRKGVLWAPLDELRAPVLLSTNELLWLPRSPDPRPAMGRAEKATRTSPVSEQVRSRCFCAHFLHSNRAVALLMPKIRLPQAAEGLLIPSCLFGPGRAETNRPSFLSLRPFCLFALPSQQQHQISSNCRQRQSESRGSSGDRSGSRKKERQQQGQQQQGQHRHRVVSTC